MPDQCMVSSQNPDYYVGECAEFLHRTLFSGFVTGLTAQ